LYEARLEAYENGQLRIPLLRSAPKPAALSGSGTSVFTVTESTAFTRAERVYIAGPRAGQTEKITDFQEQVHRRVAEVQYGRLIEGGWFSDPKFIPGMVRKTLPFFEGGKQVGYVDETGIHRYSISRVGIGSQS
jgi:hypothetical protein